MNYIIISSFPADICCSFLFRFITVTFIRQSGDGKKFQGEIKNMRNTEKVFYWIFRQPSDKIILTEKMDGTGSRCRLQ